jgi:DNA-directed RNA polymerase specialized sigma subunit
MSQKLYVRLSEDDRAPLEKMTRSGSGKPRQIARARILLLADRNQPEWRTQEQIAEAVGVSPVTVSRICRRFCSAPAKLDQHLLLSLPESGRA